MRAHTFPYVEVKNPRPRSNTSQHLQDQRGPAFYCLARGIAQEDAVNMIVSGFCKSVFKSCRWNRVEAQTCWP